MIIDIHGHVSAPQGLYAYKSGLLAARGSHGRGGTRFTDEQIEQALNAKSVFGDGHLDQLKKHGTDLQLLSPRPFQMMHSERPAKIVQWLHEEFHNVIAHQVRLHPDTFKGVAGLAQVAGLPVEVALPELERCVKELGFVGTLVNPDPYENSGTEPPAMSDRYWYPLYEKLCELDIPAMIHTASSKSERTPYSLHFVNEETIAVVDLCKSDVFKDFPTLKIIVPHGGGAVPYQFGRFHASTAGRPPGERFLDRLRNLYFDCTLYTPEAVELLVKVVGVDRVMFGSECPGTGSYVNPETGHAFDHVRPYVEAIDWLSDADRTMIFEGTAKRVFKLDQ
jgi:predicted TIM-barrel fold metal-dependent hydrolase